MKKCGDTEVDTVLKQLDEQHSKYKFMEYSIVGRKKRLRQQIPDLTKSLDMVKILKNRKEIMDTQTLLSEQVFVKTEVAPTESVYLWLGANVMLEYPLAEAEDLLKQNLSSAVENLTCLEHDQEFLRYLFQIILTLKVLTKQRKLTNPIDFGDNIK